MNPLAQALALLQQEARPAELAGMARFGINPAHRLGLSVPALRNIGKRNAALNAAAIEAAKRIQLQGSKSARWIAADTLRELTSVAVQGRIRACGPGSGA